MSPGSGASPRRSVRCPGCGRDTDYSPANAWRPFCSERCKSGDFGAWASESYRVAAPPPTESEDTDPAP